MEDKDTTDDQKRDRLMSEWILRIATLEKLLLSKGIITDEELASAYTESVSKMTEFMRVILAQKENKN